MMMMMLRVLLCCLSALVFTAGMPVDHRAMRLKLDSVRKELEVLSKAVQRGDLRLHTPSADIHDCCSLAALRCFRDGAAALRVHSKKDLQKKLVRNLNSGKMEQAADRCGAEESQKVTCDPCDSYPKLSSHDFIKQLETFIQKTYTVWSQ